MVRGCDTRDRRAYSRVGCDLERERERASGRRGEGRRSLRRRRNGDEHSHGGEDPLGSTSWKHGRGSATRVGQLSSRGTGKGESSFSLCSHPLFLCPALESRKSFQISLVKRTTRSFVSRVNYKSLRPIFCGYNGFVTSYRNLFSTS